MDESARHFSHAIESVSRALSEWTVNRLEELAPDLPARYGATWRRDWVASTRVCLQYLAQAVAVRRPILFASSVAWTRTAFDARSIEHGDLRQSMLALREIVSEELPAPAAAVATEHIDLAIDQLAESEQSLPKSFVDPSAPLGPATLHYLEAILEGNREKALGVIEGLANGGTSVPKIYTEVLQPALAEIGRMWHLGEIAIADEHFGTAVTEMAMSMLRLQFTKAPRRDRTLLAAAIGGELHALGVRMVSDFFELDGWDVYLLGANTPDEALVEAVRTQTPDLVALSVISLLNIRALGDTIAQLKADAACSGVPILVGGPPFRVAPDLWKELGADACASSALESVDVGNTLVTANGATGRPAGQGTDR